MIGKQFGKNLAFVIFSRVVSLFSSVAVGFLIPMIFGIEDYGYFKTFTLYAAYTALLHFGFVDGVLLKLAGKEYSEIDARRVRGYTCFFVGFELIIALSGIFLGGCLAKGEASFLIVMLSLSMLFTNITTYYQFISQATQRFSEYSAKSVIVSAAKLLLAVMLWGISSWGNVAISYRFYLCSIIFMDFAMMLWYVAIYRYITFGERYPFKKLWPEIFDLFKRGIVLTVAYQISHLILTLDRQFVNILYSTEEFAVYSFAYNIVSMISTVVSSLSVVLLPVLKNVNKQKITEHYQKCVTVVSITVGFLLAGYFPLTWFIEKFLSTYRESVKYIQIVLPSILFTAGITVVMFTFEKILDRNCIFFRNACIALVSGIFFNGISYWIWKTPEAISYASLVTVVIWFIVEGNILRQVTRCSIFRTLMYNLSITIGFLTISNWISDLGGAMIVYIGYVLLVTFGVYRGFLTGITKK